MENSEIKVSICCLTYNHEKYIRQALDSFLMQKTNFKYEVLIHDDASTDGTQDIIREYEERYPDIIKPIYQIENQHKKHIKKNWKFQYPRAQGKYIAMCEGDDFWCDENKLQLQYDTLESKDAVFCAHQVRFVTEGGEKTDLKKPNCRVDYYQSGDDFLRTLLKQNICPFQTSSFMFRRDAVIDYCNEIPQFIKVAPVGDVVLLMLLGTKGNVCYLNQEMSCYRMFSVSSWSLAQKNDKGRRIRHEQGLCETFAEFNVYTNYAYNELVEYQINERKLNLLRLNESYREMLKPPFLAMVKQLPVKEKLYIICSAKLPVVMKIYKHFKSVITIDR